MVSTDAFEFLERVEDALKSGKRPSHIARDEGCSQTTLMLKLARLGKTTGMCLVDISPKAEGV